MSGRPSSHSLRLSEAARLGEAGQTAAALAALLALIDDAPQLAAAYFGAAEMLHRLGQRDQAIERIGTAIALEPANPHAAIRLAGWLLARGRKEDVDMALNTLAAGCEHCLDNVELRAEYFFALFDQQRYRDALPAIDRALALAPGSAVLHTNRAAVLFKLNRLDESYQEDHTALAINPRLAAARNGLVLTCERMGLIEEATAEAEQAAQQQADNPEHLSRVLFLANYRAALSPGEIFARHREWGRRFGEPMRQYRQPHDNLFSPDKRLRIGYVSPDFVRHSVSYFIEPVLSHHDRNKFEVFAYHCAPGSDEVTRRLGQQVEHWRNVARLSPLDLAEQIRSDGIDLLIDLAGHTANHRLLTFAMKPAPVQISYLGYPNTSGLDTMDYRISDGRADPVDQAEFCSESLLRLADCFHCYQPEPDLPLTIAPPSEQQGDITFGSFNVLGKISDQVLAAWAAILTRTPGARLRLKSFGLISTRARTRLGERLAAAGIAAERVLLDPATVTHREHMAHYRSIDIALDTFPYNGTTTTCEALWMGVPVVALAGDRHASRVGVSLLTAAGLPELIADSVDDYVERAVALAADLQRLRQYHGTLRHQLQHSPLTDAARFTGTLEQAYQAVWVTACREVKAGAR